MYAENNGDRIEKNIEGMNESFVDIKLDPIGQTVGLNIRENRRQMNDTERIREGGSWR